MKTPVTEGSFFFKKNVFHFSSCLFDPTHFSLKALIKEFMLCLFQSYFFPPHFSLLVPLALRVNGAARNLLCQSAL